MAFLKVVLSISIVLLSISCTKKNRPGISEDEYLKRSQTMLGVVGKFLSEKDIEKLHKVVIDFQLTRAVTCEDVGNECSLYLELVRKIVRFSEDGQFTEEEKRDLRQGAQALQKAVEKGRDLLREKWAKYAE